MANRKRRQLWELVAASEDEDLLLLMANGALQERRDRFPRMNIDELTDERCWNLFRFYKEDLNRLCDAFHLPDEMKCANGTSFSKLEGWCILLRRLSYPSRPWFFRSLLSRSLGFIHHLSSFTYPV
jgi:hypothetical protein